MPARLQLWIASKPLEAPDTLSPWTTNTLMTRPVATCRDRTRQPPTRTLPCRLKRSQNAMRGLGHARTLRSLQRYCVSGHLDAQKIATTTGDKYLVTPQSVARHIAQIKEFAALEAVATFRDVSRPVATAVAPETPAAPQPMSSQQDPACYARHVATGRDRERASCHGNACSAAKCSDRKQRPHTTRRDRSRQNQPRQGRRRAMSRSLNDSSKLPALRGTAAETARVAEMNATSCASRSIAKTAPSIALIERDQGNQLSRARPPRDADPVAWRRPPPGRPADLHAVVRC